MNRELMKQCLDVLDGAEQMNSARPERFEIDLTAEQIDTLSAALRAELAKPEPEPVGHQFQSRDGNWCEIVNQQHYEATLADGSWPIRPVYAAPTEPNCKFPTCHSQEYQDKLVQEILGQEPVAEITGHSYSQTNRRISFLPAGYELPVGTKLYTKEREP